MLELYENPESEKDELSLAKARAILQDELTSDEELIKVINTVKIFCKVSYELFAERKLQTQVNTEEKDLKQAS